MVVKTGSVLFNRRVACPCEFQPLKMARTLCLFRQVLLAPLGKAKTRRVRKKKKRLFFFFLCYLLTNPEFRGHTNSDPVSSSSACSPQFGWAQWIMGREGMSSRIKHRQADAQASATRISETTTQCTGVAPHSFSWIKCDVINSQLSRKPFIPPVGVSPLFTQQPHRLLSASPQGSVRQIFW